MRVNNKARSPGHRQTGSGTQPFVAGGTSWSVKNDTKYERIWKTIVPEQSSQSLSIMEYVGTGCTLYSVQVYIL